jgi:hypothetical protein
MIVSPARLEANRRNALRSTGPKTPEGKEKSRANALKHGLCSSKLVSEDLALLQQRSLEMFCALKPQSLYQNWLVDTMSVISLRIDRSARIERRVFDRKALHAELCWEDDRKLQAIRLGAMITENPADVVEQLRRTPQGCEWLMTHWAMLAYTAESVGPWTPDQTRLAFDLLGTPREFRLGQQPGASIDFEGKRLDPTETQVIIARREIADLKARREVVDGLDEVAQALSMASLNVSDEGDPDLKNLRRYEATLHNRFRWFMTQFQFKSTNRLVSSLMNDWKGDAETAEEARVEPTAEPTPEPEPEVNHLVEPEPEEVEPEPEPDAEGPIILDSRVEKRLRQAATRRASKKKKNERIRA